MNDLEGEMKLLMKCSCLFTEVKVYHHDHGINLIIVSVQNTWESSVWVDVRNILGAGSQG